MSNGHWHLLVVVSLLSILPHYTTAGTAAPQFWDVTEQAGISYLNASGSVKKDFIIETTGAGACFLDYDGDGFMDLYIVNGAKQHTPVSDPAVTNVLYRNNGDGTFTDVTGRMGGGHRGWGGGCAVGDYDNDGDPDIYVTNYGTNALYRNDEGDRFTDVAAEAGVLESRWSTGATFFDANGDGYLDIYVANYLQFDLDRIDKYPSDCYWKTARVMCGPKGFEGETDALFLNDRDGTFTDRTIPSGIGTASLYGLGVVTGDIDLDGDADILVANDSQLNLLFLNDGSGSFLERGLLSGLAVSGDGRPQAGMGIDLGDYDLDGDEDVLVTNFSNDYHVLYRNESGAQFTDVSQSAGLESSTRFSLGWGANFLDYDNDADLDIFIAGGHVYPQVDGADPLTTYRQTNLLLRNERGRFVDATTEAGPGLRLVQPSRGVAIADYDNDGDLDLFVVNENDRPTLLRNDGGNANHWIKIRLRGTSSNRDGIGAKIKVRSGGRTQFREHRLSSGYYSSHDPRVHFGLGTDAEVDELEVQWPSGRRQIFRKLAANKLITISESEGLESIEPLATLGSAIQTPQVEGVTAVQREPRTFRTAGAQRIAPLSIRRVDALVQRGTVAIKAGLYERGIEDYETALGLLPDWEAARQNPDALGFGDPTRYQRFLFSLYDNLGVGLMRAERLEECQHAITRALEILPGQAKAFHNLGLCHMHARRYDPAVVSLREARALDGENIVVAFDLGRTLANAGKCREAIELLPGVLTSLPIPDLNDRSATGWYLLGGCYSQTEDHRSAIEAFRKALSVTPGHQRALYKLIVATGRAGMPQQRDRLRQLYEARQPTEDTLRSLKRSAPSDLASRLSLAESYLEAGQAANAYREAMSVLAALPAQLDASNLAGHAALALRPAALSLARRAFERSLRANPSDARALAGLAELERRQRRLPEAERLFNKAIGIEPQESSAHGLASVGLARIMLESGRVEQGLEVLTHFAHEGQAVIDPEVAITMVELHIAAGNIEGRRKAAAMLESLADNDLYGKTDERRVGAFIELGRLAEAKELIESSSFLTSATRALLGRQLAAVGH